MHILQPCARWAHKHPIIHIYLPTVGRIYPLLEYICQLLAEYIQYQNISANCWQNISNIRIYPPIVGRIYPIPEYICQLLAIYTQYKNISPIVGRIYLARIYPIPLYIYIHLSSVKIKLRLLHLLPEVSYCF